MAQTGIRPLIPGAPKSLSEILEGARGPVQAPIRSEIFGLQRFAQHGRSLGTTHRAARAGALAASFFPRLRSNMVVLREARHYIGVHAQTGYDISPAAEWLLDNFHLIEAQLNEIHEGLPRSYFRALPMLQDEPLVGLPRVYGIAWAFVAHTDGAFDEDLLQHFLCAYQETRELNLSELWALPTTLRVVLVENLRRLAERVATNKAAREVANRVCDDIENYTLNALDHLLAKLNQRGVGRVFLGQMAQRLQDRAGVTPDGGSLSYQDWIKAALPDLAAVRAQQSTDQAADNLSVSNAVTSLRAIGDADWTGIVGHTSPLMQLMLTQPLFEAEDNATRDQTLHGIELQARRSGTSELSVARILLALMDNPAGDGGNTTSTASHWLQGPGRNILNRAVGGRDYVNLAWRATWRRMATPVYLGVLLLGTWGLMHGALLFYPHGGASSNFGSWLPVLVAILMVFPASEVMVAVINRLISESVHPRQLPRLSLANGIPPEHRVMVVIPGMLSNHHSARDLVHRLQLHYLANPEVQAQFALLTDWADADTADQDSDEPLLVDAVEQIERLNVQYPTLSDGGPRFLLLHRRRMFCETERRWIGWERKRGKLEQLVTALAQGHSDAFVNKGETSRISTGIKYVVTLDSDTQLPPGRLRELVGVAAHPHNWPRLDSTGHKVISGYGILQPRVATPLPSQKEMTLYHWLFAGQCGIDPYSASTSEIYQDLFEEGSFMGKGLLHVGAMHAVLSGRLPTDLVLSHDLIEGSLVRCATVANIDVVEEAPFHADVAATRQHRWIRGDWQLLPVLLNPKVFPLNGINRWKMVDNLRRSLVAPMSLALLLVSLTGTGITPWAAMAMVFAAFSGGPLIGAVSAFAPSRDDVAKKYFYRLAMTDMARALWGGLWHLAMLPYQAILAGDAIGRALYRMTVSQRHLLQWTTAATVQAQAQTRSRFRHVAAQHWSLPVVAIGLFGALQSAVTPYPFLALGLCLLWAASPIWIWWVSRVRPADKDAALPTADQVKLQGIARDTWRFFERCIGPQDNFLPPDNLQINPHDMVAHRTSPTNIGLYMLSVACARSFGWIGTQELLTRLEATMATLNTLQRHKGHFLNWYDTQTCLPLLPLYVSTVDSGNLSGHLLAVARACLELANSPFDVRPVAGAIYAARQRLAPLLATRARLNPAMRTELRWLLADHRATLRSAKVDANAASLKDDSGSMGAKLRLQTLARECEQLAWQADFSFLYHRKRHLFHIGYRVREQQLDAGFYDLLASESRLTSLLAIAKGDAPVRHWAALGRPFYAVGAEVGLRSWSGSMFEYLMPSLVLDEPVGSVLQGAGHAALREQIAYARTQGVPWGISESAYAASDHTLAYQYAPQGVPALALRRTPSDELVIAPYATALGALVVPHLAVNNFAALQALATRGRYGFIESLDYSPTRQAGNSAFTPVETFMAHHQGMSIVALANVLLDGVAQRWGMANPHIEAVVSLLHERAPREVFRPSIPTSSLLPEAPLQRRSPGMLREVQPGDALEPTHVLSNGRYSVTLRANGAGWSRKGSIGITRWRDDALRDSYGSFFYLRWERQPQVVSITQHPAPDVRAHYSSTFHTDRVCFDATWEHMQAHTTVWVSPEDDIEFRQVEVRNLSDRTLDIELLSAFDVTLADPRADESHAAFSNLFVVAEWHHAHQALMFTRKPRLPSEQGLQAAHFLADSDPQIVEIRIQTDRQRWLGRNRSLNEPLASFDHVPKPRLVTPKEHGSEESDVLQTGLDPVCAFAVRLRIAPNAKAQLTFATAASASRETLNAIIDKYRQPAHVQRASLMSATLTGIRLRALAISSENYAAIQTLTTAMAMNLTRASAPVAETCDRRLLWRFGISGDRPILLVSACIGEGLGLLRVLSQALRVWSWGSIDCDLVVVNSEPSSYLMPLQREIGTLRERHLADTGVEHDQAGRMVTSFHLLQSAELSSDEFSTLQNLARVRLNADGRPLLHHVAEWGEFHEQFFMQRLGTSTTAVPVASGTGSVVAVPVGEFTPNSGEFEFEVSANLRPARPWINVLSNPAFGAQLSEAGGGYTWAVNSRLNQLTAWSNDPVADPPSEWFLLQDTKTNQVWSVTSGPWGDARVRYHVSHGQGVSTISHRREDMEVTVSWCVDPVTSVKQVFLQLVNHGYRTSHLRVIGIAEWMMGASRGDRATVHTSLFRQRLPVLSALTGKSHAQPAQKLTTLLCTQMERSGGYGDGTAFFGIVGDASEDEDWTCDRRECFDSRGRLVLPDHFGQQQGPGLDPCAALSTRIRLAAGESGQRVFLLGYGATPDVARQLATVSAATSATLRLQSASVSWSRMLGAVTVKTPDHLLDAMVNHWLLYQTITCRLWAKAGFYQAGGATGYRDQLQDAMALSWAAPQTLRQQIVLCASRQFIEGDVQHWWHAPLGTGVRTHFSDDLLWLPYACAHYLRTTGDETLLDQNVPFLDGLPIPDGAEDAYYTPTISQQTASVFEHGARAIDRSLRVGIHGLPLMGSGDWNDGMNRVGIQGRGESVWLGWFLCKLVADFAPIAHRRGESNRAQRWETAAQGWKAALIGPAWDGQWFKRAFFDDGQPLGSSTNTEARIDLIAQAWAVLSGVAPEGLQRMAMAAVEEHLVDHGAGLIRLLDPPLAHAVPSAGYIQAYPPGVRENGGQYSHAGIWALMAQAAFSQAHQNERAGGDLVYRYFTYLSPAHRALHTGAGGNYAIEPYVMAGDVYSHPPYAGRGGWSWYTGAAAWMHRAVIESMFGLNQNALELSFTPCFPSHWKQAELTLVRNEHSMRFVFVREQSNDALAATVQWGAQLLRRGQFLSWTELAPTTCFVIPLLDDSPTQQASTISL